MRLVFSGLENSLELTAGDIGFASRKLCSVRADCDFFAKRVGAPGDGTLLPLERR